MKSRKIFISALGVFAFVAVSGTGFSAFSRVSAPVRDFEFTYVTKIPALPSDAKISKIWIPLPQSDSYQAISDLKIDSPFPYATHRDSEYGNEYVYLEIPAEKAAAAEVRAHFQVARQEHRVALEGNPGAAKGEGATAPDTQARAQDLKRFRSRSEEHTSELQSPDHLVCRL